MDMSEDWMVVMDVKAILDHEDPREEMEEMD
jgi:hypothetical protein